MNVFDCIKSRRTVKTTAMDGSRLADEQVWKCLEAAHWAPNHGRTEPWHFFVYTDDALKVFCADHAAIYAASVNEADLNPNKMATLQQHGDYASHLVLVVMKRTPNAKIPAEEEYAATAAAVQNLLLAAEAQGIASIWSTGGMVLQPAMHQYLQLSTEDVVLGCIYLGKAKTTPSEGTRKATVAEKTTWKH